MWLLAGPRKCNWPSVTFRSVFQNPVTYLGCCIAITVNRERFAGLNFCSLQEYHESFIVNILYKLWIMALFKCFKRKALLKFSRENFIGWNPQYQILPCLLSV